MIDGGNIEDLTHPSNVAQNGSIFRVFGHLLLTDEAYLIYAQGRWFTAKGGNHEKK